MNIKITQTQEMLDDLRKNEIKVGMPLNSQASYDGMRSMYKALEYLLEQKSFNEELVFTRLPAESGARHEFYMEFENGEMVMKRRDIQTKEKND